MTEQRALRPAEGRRCIRDVYLRASSVPSFSVLPHLSYASPVFTSCLGIVFLFPELLSLLVYQNSHMLTRNMLIKCEIISYEVQQCTEL